ncbi:MAG: ubiquinone/menaquinone biosynthesis C-methylase UbiE [Candidatus Latescibacterota bacterium]|jgi:ubiquinone/menaquinone biosynthesis C-methylase UbiE
MSPEVSTTVSTARDYYNSGDADNFYALIWGGEDIHIGLYEAVDEAIATASHRTVEHLAAQLGPLERDVRVLDLGSGYGGAARYLATTYAARVTALNLSEVENERHRQMNERASLSERIEVVDGNFEEIPCDDAQFDVVWSQDAILHSGERARVLREVDRVLKPGGQFIFTDPMQADDCPAGVLQPILDRIHLNSLGSPGFYSTQAELLGWRDLGFSDHTQQLVNHYQRVLEETVKAEQDLLKKVGAAYIERMKKGLGHWVEGGRAGHLAWGVLHFKKI